MENLKIFLDLTLLLENMYLAIYDSDTFIPISYQWNTSGHLVLIVLQIQRKYNQFHFPEKRSIFGTPILLLMLLEIVDKLFLFQKKNNQKRNVQGKQNILV